MRAKLDEIERVCQSLQCSFHDSDMLKIDFGAIFSETAENQ